MGNGEMRNYSSHTAVVILGCFLLLCFLPGCRRERIDFPHGYRWVIIAPNRSAVLNPAGERIVSGYLALWGKDPYLYGNGDDRNREFVINLQTKEIIFFDSFREFNAFLEQKGLPPFYVTARRNGTAIAGDRHQTTLLNIFYLKDSRSQEFLRNMNVE